MIRGVLIARGYTVTTYGSIHQFGWIENCRYDLLGVNS